MNNPTAEQVDAEEMKRREDDSIRFGVGYFNTDTERTSHELIRLMKARKFPREFVQHAVELAWRYETSSDVRGRVDLMMDLMLESRVEAFAKQRAMAAEIWAERDARDAEDALAG